MTISLPQEKRSAIISKCKCLLSKESVKILELAEVVGLLISALPAVPYGLLHTKKLERNKYLSLSFNNKNYSSKTLLYNDAKMELEWWLSKLPTTFMTIRQDFYELVIFSDASDLGWGAACNDMSTGGGWTEAEMAQHINYKELLAAYYALLCFASKLRNRSVLLRIDNMTAMHYINRMGSIKYPHLFEVTEKIWHFCEERNLHINASYIASKDNIVADFESRNSHVDLELSNDTFKWLSHRFGIPSIDLFASHCNRKCVRYCSLRPDPYSICTDAFTIGWGDEFIYAFPPVSVIARVLRKMKHDKCQGIVVVPYWESQPWFPLFVQMLISDPEIFSCHENVVLYPNRQENQLTSSQWMVGLLSGEST